MSYKYLDFITEGISLLDADIFGSSFNEDTFGLHINAIL